MNLLLNNKKIFIIIGFVLLCGLILNFSRSSFVLKSSKNEEVLNVPLDPQQAVFTGESNDANYCIVYTDDTVELKDNVAKTFDYLQKNYTLLNATTTVPAYDECEHVLLAAGSLQLLGAIDTIEQYIQQGGHLFLLQTPEPNSHFQILSRPFGITDYNGYGIINGLHMTSNLLLGAEDKEFLTSTLADSSLNVAIADDATLYMESTAGKPVLWKTNMGEGAVMILNATILYEKVSRGILVGMLSHMDDTFIYPIFNAKTFYIDDFPAPIARGRNEIIYSEFQMDLDDFYRNIWWPDMLRIANTANIYYTGAIIQSYNDKVTPPFDAIEDDEVSTLVSYGRELIQGHGEIGIHGYNHQSLTLDRKISNAYGYNNWESTEHMVMALKELHAYIDKAFPAYDITSYVPPSNVLSDEGRVALKEAFPTLKVIASLYSSDPQNRSLIQEFTIGDDDIVDMPRISSGYYRNDSNEWEIANAMTTHGVFSHFIHPDDVISEDRSNGGWGDMIEEFELFMHDISARYPWLRALSATKAAYYQAATLQSRFAFEESEHRIDGTIENYTMPQYFVFHSTRDIEDQENCTIEQIEANTYLVTVTNEQFSIELGGDAS